MTSVPLGTSDWRRGVAAEAEIPVHNRYFEQNPANLTEQTALLSRPGLRRWLEVGEGPIRAVYSQPGSFDDALFVVSFDTLYRVDVDGTVTSLGSGLFGETIRSRPQMCATASLSGDPGEYLYVCDGKFLWLYDGSTVTQVATPDDVGVVSVAFIAGYVIVVVAQGYDWNGRFFWIEPGDDTIDALNFATAERVPDPVLSVRVVGDQFWLLGTNSTEVWYPTGDPTSPFARVQSRVFNRGIWEGTDVQIKDSVIVVDTDGVVYEIGDSPRRISNNSIEERIREAMRIAETSAP